MSENADDVIPPSALQAPSAQAPGPVDDIIPTAALSQPSAPSPPKPRSWLEQRLDTESTRTFPIGGALASAATGAASDIGATGAVLKGLFSGDVKSLGDAARISEAYQAAHPPYTPPEGSAASLINKVVGSPYNPINYPGELLDAGGNLLSKGLDAAGVPSSISTAVGPIASGAAQVGVGTYGVAKGLSAARGTPAAADAAITAQEAANQVAAKTSGGAAATGVNVNQLSPETQAELVRAVQAGEPISQTAIERHALAESLPLPQGTSPLRLRAGQATGDAQQISDEKNLRADPDTQGLLSNSITDQDQKLVLSMGEIRRQATPTVVQNNNLEHGQTAIDAIKSTDNAAVTDTRAKYQALADANGGMMPIDTGQAISGIDAQLQNRYLTKTAQENPVISSVMDDLRSGNPINFEKFENARTGLAEVQRGGGSDAVAAGIVHNALEQMPLTPEAAALKALADPARAAAKAHFNTIKQNPAYKAAINDNVSKDPQTGLHVIGADSPLADSFMDRYFLGNGPNASSAYIQRLKGIIPDLSEPVEAAALNKLSNAAGIDQSGNSTGFRNDSYRNARNALEPKADVLLSPESAEATNQLKQVSGFVNDEGKASTTNRSNTALTLQRFGAQADKITGGAGSQLADYGSDLVAGHLGPGAVVAKHLGQSYLRGRAAVRSAQALQDAKLQFAQHATAPGAGIGQ